MPKKIKREISINEIVNSNGCFDLQFRKDVKKERLNSPTYYRWKAQFVVTSSVENIKLLKKIKETFNCGKISKTKNQARFSVQKIDNIIATVVPFFIKNPLQNNKKKNFELWVKAVEILQRNKGKSLSGWKNNEICSLIEIHKSSVKYKNNPRAPKWFDMAKTFCKRY